MAQDRDYNTLNRRLLNLEQQDKGVVIRTGALTPSELAERESRLRLVDGTLTWYVKVDGKLWKLDFTEVP